MVSKSCQNSGAFPHCLVRHSNGTRGRRRKKKKDDLNKEKNGQIEVAVEQVLRMQADGFTGGVPLTDRISGGFNIKGGRSGRAEIPADALDGCQGVSQRLVLTNKKRLAQITQLTSSTTPAPATIDPFTLVADTTRQNV